jgi:lysophospholipase L1-like esterase
MGGSAGAPLGNAVAGAAAGDDAQSAAGTGAGTAGSGTAGASSTAGSGPVSAAATLSALSPSVGALLPVFSPAIRSYSWRVPSGTASLSLTPTASGTPTAITVNDALVASGTASPLVVVPSDGMLTFTIKTSGALALAGTTYTVKLSLQPAPTELTIYSVGDSTMADYQPSMDPNQRGWMQLFPLFLSSDVKVFNFGINGSSSKSFYRSPAWDSVKGRILPGDYVFIQFGHNDEKDGGIEGASGIGTAAWDAYHDYLTKYVNEAKALGGVPILFTPIVRLDWAGAKISAVGSHDLTAAGAPADSANYPAAMRDVATKLGCPLVDLTLLSKALVEQYGPVSAKADLYVSVDNTHLQPMGASSVAQLAAQGLVKQGLSSAQLKPALGVRLSDSALQFDQHYVGSTVARAFSLFGLSLAPVTGTVRITAPTGFALSAGTGVPSATLELPYVLGALPPTTVQVHFQPEAAADYAASLSLKPGTGAALNLALTAKALAPPAGATEVEARYPLDAASTTSCVPKGAATCAAESFAGSYSKDYASITLLLPVPTSVLAQRVSALSTPVADSWPLEAALNPSRYVQFTLTPSAGKSASIDTVSLYAGAASGTLGLHASFSTQADFSAAIDLFDAPSNDVNVLTFRSASPVASVAPNGTFYLRVYPFSKTASTKTALSLESVLIHGVSYEPK